jgi:hypothetical protein
MVRVTHQGKYCGACTENSVMPMLPKCQMMQKIEEIEMNECDTCGLDDAECNCYLHEVADRVSDLEYRLNSLMEIIKELRENAKKKENK